MAECEVEDHQGPGVDALVTPRQKDRGVDDDQRNPRPEAGGEGLIDVGSGERWSCFIATQKEYSEDQKPDDGNHQQVGEIYCPTAQSELLSFPLTPALSRRGCRKSPSVGRSAGVPACTFHFCDTLPEGEGVKCADCSM